jgi:ribosomal protein S18 acetylase RimI-like enzyme
VIEITRLRPVDGRLLQSVADGVFVGAVQPGLAAEMLADPRHHLVVARDGELIVGFVSGVHYVHPDKPAQMFINEVGVAPSYQRRGIARRLLSSFAEHAAVLGCTEAWVLTEPENVAANALYAGFAEAPAATVMYTITLAPAAG